MSKTGGPDLKKYLDKKLAFKLNGNRKVTGVLRGFDQFMNIVLDETIDEGSSDKNDIGLVVSGCGPPMWFGGPGWSEALPTSPCYPASLCDDHGLPGYIVMWVRGRFRANGAASAGFVLLRRRFLMSSLVSLFA